MVKGTDPLAPPLIKAVTLNSKVIKPIVPPSVCASVIHVLIVNAESGLFYVGSLNLSPVVYVAKLAAYSPPTSVPLAYVN
jgi:hypothetical protein